VASPVFKTGVTRQRRVGWVRFPHSPVIAALVAAFCLFGPVSAAAQRDSAKVKVRGDSISDSLPRQWVTPRRAFLSSMLFPGYGQLRMGRSNAGALYAIVEVLCLSMAGKAAMDLREANRIGTDSIPTEYTVNPTTGEVTASGWEQSRFNEDRIRARRTHYEDWVVAVLYNHLISGIDAFIYANFWDFPGKPEVSQDYKGTTRLRFSFSW
jgi:hypothetical protein